MSNKNNFYDVLGINKTASSDEIKKAYRKKAMKYHPDRNAGNKEAESKFKEINEAYGVLSDNSKKKQYDMFGSSGGSSFGGNSGYSSEGFGGFEDMFGGMGGTRGGAKGGGINIEDLFGGAGESNYGRSYSSKANKEEPINLDFEKTYEVPIFDLILGCKIEVKGVYGQLAKLKIPAGTKPATKFRVKNFGKSEGIKKGNLIVKVEALMPKNISEVDKSMLERIREGVGY